MKGESNYIRIGKNQSEVIRVELTEYSGYELIGLRVYVIREYQDPTTTIKGQCTGIKIHIRSTWWNITSNLKSDPALTSYNGKDESDLPVLILST